VLIVTCVDNDIATTPPPRPSNRYAGVRGEGNQRRHEPGAGIYNAEHKAAQHRPATPEFSRRAGK
jgi:hypothetical protein